MVTVAMRSTEVGHRRFTRNQVHAPARSVDLITAVMYEAFLPADARASAVGVSMAGVFLAGGGGAFMAGAAVVNRTAGRIEFIENFKNGEKYHAAQFFNCHKT